MKGPSRSILEEIDDFFESAPTANQKAWGLIHEFYHLVLTYMEKKKISKSDLAQRLGKSRSAITQMFNKTPNISIKKMVEIADAIGIEISIYSKQVQMISEGENRTVTHALNLYCGIAFEANKEPTAMPLSMGEGASGIFLTKFNDVYVKQAKEPSAKMTPIDSNRSTQVNDLSPIWIQ